MTYLLAIDQGTTSSRAMIFDGNGQLRGLAQQEFAQHYPKEGWVEHDPDVIWSSVCQVVKSVLLKTGVAAGDIAALGITNQRETTLAWHSQTGAPAYPAIVWQDRRTAQQCEALKSVSLAGRNSLVSLKAKTGLLLDPYFSATKMAWILNQSDLAQQWLEQDQLRIGTIDTFLVWKLTGGKRFVTDATNASRTNLFNIVEQRWDQELCDFFGVPVSILPEVLDSAADFGQCDPALFGAGIPICAVAGDQHAALVGQACFSEGMSKCTFGTGCFLNINTGDTPIYSSHGLITTMAYRLNGKATYAVEGSAFIAGAVVQWLRDGLHLLTEAKASQAMALAAKDSKVYFVPALTGLGAPHWNPEARGAIFGLSRDTGPNEIVAAALESVSFQAVDLIRAMVDDGATCAGLRVDGGFVANDFAMQTLANLLQMEVVRPAMIETTALGVAYLAGLQCGVWQSTDEIADMWQRDRTFTVERGAAWASSRYDQWQRAVEACQHFS